MAIARNISTDESPKAKISKESLREAFVIFKYLRPYRAQFIGGLIFIALSAANTMTFPLMLQKLIDSEPRIGAAISHSSLGVSMPQPTGINLPFHVTPGTVALIMIGLLCIQIFISYFRIYFFSVVGENVVADMRKDIYKHMIMMPMDFFAQRRVGELSSRITADVSQIQTTVTSVFAEIIRGILTLAIGVILLLFIGRKMTLLMLSIVPVIVIVALIFSKFIRKLSRQAQDQLADSGTIVQETLQGITNVKAFSNEWHEINRYNQNIKKVVGLAVNNGRYTGMFVSTMLFTVFGAVILVVWYGVSVAKLSAGDLTAFVVVTAFVGGSLAGFADQYTQLQKTLGATQRVRELLNEQTENVDIDNIHVQHDFRLKGSVSLQNIGFSYPSRRDIEVIKNVSIEANSGEQIAIVGPSGAGKSTIVGLLLKFYHPTRGKILFDGKDADEIPLSQLRKQMALVPQDILLFGGTIFENIAYGNPEATLLEVKAAALKANAHDFIMGFPEAYDTVVGERGVKLSGGQRQRIAIARAILKDPVILLLDEATSSLDSESESLVQEALDNLMKNRTSFVIAHRLSTIRKADKIIVLEDGIVKESGTHQELIKIEEGLYRNLNKLQLFES